MPLDFLSYFFPINIFISSLFSLGISVLLILSNPLFWDSLTLDWPGVCYIDKTELGLGLRQLCFGHLRAATVLEFTCLSSLYPFLTLSLPVCRYVCLCRCVCDCMCSGTYEGQLLVLFFRMPPPPLLFYFILFWLQISGIFPSLPFPASLVCLITSVYHYIAFS